MFITVFIFECSCSTFSPVILFKKKFYYYWSVNQAGTADDFTLLSIENRYSKGAFQMSERIINNFRNRFKTIEWVVNYLSTQVHTFHDVGFPCLIFLYFFVNIFSELLHL